MSTPLSCRITDELSDLSTEEKRLVLPRFFKTGCGEYGEGDKFLGVVVPDTRKVAKAHAMEATVADIMCLLASAFHEVRLCGLVIMMIQFCKGDDEAKTMLFNLYLSHTYRVNNWDLVDMSAPCIVGRYLLYKPRDVLYRLSESPLLWDNRIAIVSTLTFIRNGDLGDTYCLAQKLMSHPHDLMHKATGWMLREAGKHDKRRLYNFVDRHHAEMPRTMLRYAIEKFSRQERLHLMRR